MIIKISCLFFFMPMSFALLAQEDVPWKAASEESQAYHAYRLKSTVPAAGLQKIKKQIAAIKPNSEDDQKLPASVYRALSLREQFTYHMIHAESYSQNCDAMPPIQDEQKKIFGQLPDAFDEYRWSEDQIKFFKTNRDSVISLLQESIARTHRVGLNFKIALTEINAKEMIPLLISTYNISKKDHDILTVLMLLMKENKYTPFVSSASFAKLYGDDGNYGSFLVFNAANEALIINRATAFSQLVNK